MHVRLRVADVLRRRSSRLPDESTGRIGEGDGVADSGRNCCFTSTRLRVKLARYINYRFCLRRTKCGILWFSASAAFWRVLGLIFVPAEAGAQTASGGTPVPTAVGPIPVTADSYPQMTVKRIQQVVDLDGAGYVEEEFFVSGTGNAYDWAQDGSLSVLASGLPYTTRIMVRRPVNASRFSGNVVVELINNSRTYDWPMAWSVLFPHILESGHAYVGISIRPRGIDSMKKFNPARYEPLSFGAPQQACPGKAAAADRREDVHWDIISQVGALLKTPRSSGPLAGFNVQRMYVTADDGDVATYVNAIHAHAKMADGRSIYDGYLHKGNAYPGAHQCLRPGAGRQRSPAQGPRRQRARRSPAHGRRCPHFLQHAARRQRCSRRSLPSL